MKQVVTTCIALLLVQSPAIVALSSSEERARELAKERDKLERERDPVDRAKIGIKISEILLEDVADAVRLGDFGQMEQQLNEYAETIQDAHQTLMDSGRDAQRRSGGFKDLEIALRKHVRWFDDHAKLLTLDRREPMERVKDIAGDIREQLLKALFP